MTDTDYEAIGRETAERLGVKPNLWDGCYSWHDDNRDMTGLSGQCYIPSMFFRNLDWSYDFVAGTTSLKSEVEAYTALGKSVALCWLACDGDGKVRAAVEAERMRGKKLRDSLTGVPSTYVAMKIAEYDMAGIASAEACK